MNGVRCNLCAATLLALAACASPGPGLRPAAGPAAPPAPPDTSAGDAAYDWHALVLAPFGTLLKDSPIPVHEVLFFQDEAHANEAGKDCFAIDGVPPRLVGHTPDQYLLCFEHDRLNRIEAAVRLPADEAAQTFAQACALWSKSPAPAAAIGSVCEGRDAGIAFSARLVPVPGESVAQLSMTLSRVAPHESVQDAVRDAPHER